MPPRGVSAADDETLDYLCGWFRIFQYERGHRYSTDDVLTAWYATQWAPRVARAADLGSGIGSVALITAWRLPGAHFCTVEAQAMSARLARKSIRYNGLESRFTVREGDLRDETILANEAPFDLVTGSPPYWPSSAATGAAHPQAVPARILATGGMFVFVFPFIQLARAEEALAANGLVLVRRRDVIFKEGEMPMISLFSAMRAADLPPGREAWIEPPLIIRTKNGSVHPEYAAIRISFGFPPGDIPAAPTEDVNGTR